MRKDLQETVSHEYIFKILLADFYIDKNYYIDMFHFDDYLNKQLTGSSENQFFFRFDRFRGGVTILAKWLLEFPTITTLVLKT